MGILIKNLCDQMLDNLKNMFPAALGKVVLFKDRRVNDIVMLTALSLASAQAAYGLAEYIDIHMGDSVSYLKRVFLPGLPPAPYAPLYTLYYKILAWLQGDGLKLYYLNFQIITFSIPIYFYAVLRAFRVPTLLSGILSFFLILSSTGIFIPKRVANAGLIVVCLSLVLSRIPKDKTTALVVLCSGFLFSSLVRPELFLAFVILSLTLAFRIYRQRSLLQYKFLLAGLVLISLLLLLSFGFPIKPGSERAYRAFGQHYLQNYLQWNQGKQVDALHWRGFTKQRFGEDSTFWGAVTYNPGEFQRHVRYNAKRFKNGLVRHTTGFFKPSTLHKTGRYRHWLFIGLLLVWLAWFIKKKSDMETKLNLKARAVEMWVYCIALIAVLVPILFSNIVISPKPLHLFPFLFYTSILVLLFFFGDTDRVAVAPVIAVITASMLFVSMTPGTSNYVRDGKTENLKIVQTLRTIAGKEAKIKVLGSTGDRYCYLMQSPKNCRQYYGHIFIRSYKPKQQPLLEFINDAGIDFVLLSGRFLKQLGSRLKDPADYFKDYASYGFVKVDAASGNKTILVNTKRIKNTTGLPEPENTGNSGHGGGT